MLKSIIPDTAIVESLSSHDNIWEAIVEWTSPQPNLCSDCGVRLVECDRCEKCGACCDCTECE